MWMSWKTIIKARTRAPAQSDSAMSTTSTAALPAPGGKAVDAAAPTLSVFQGDALASVTEKYKLGKVIGKGSYGTVFAGTRLDDGAPVAVKTIPKAKLTDRVFLEDVRREGQIMRLANHPSITALYDLCEDDFNVYFVEEMCTGGELFEKIVADGSFSEADAARVFESAVRAVDHLHQIGVAHRDIKPENFLLAGQDGGPMASRLRLCDFGLATYALPGTKLTELVGSAPYVAPEVITRSYSLEADVWSLGVVLYVMLSGMPAFWSTATSGGDAEIFQQILGGHIDLDSPPWPSISADAKDLVARLLRRDPAARPTAAAALAHPWLRAQGASESPLDPVVPRRLARFAGMSRLKRAALITAAGSLPSTNTAALRALFDSLDSDGDGTLTAEELRAGVGKLTSGSAVDADTLDAAVAAVTRSNRGLTYSAFVAATHTAAALTRESALHAAFDSWDADHSGSLTVEEVEKALAAAGLQSDDGGVASMFAEVDTSGDGVINFEEFLAMATTALEADAADDDCRRATVGAARARAAAAAERVVSGGF